MRLSIEDFEQEPAVTTEIDFGPMEEASAEVDKFSGYINDGEQAVASINATADVLEAYGDEEAPQAVVDVAAIGIEHYCNQVQYQRRNMQVSMESFGNKKGSTKQMAIELRVAQEKIADCTRIAQEGFIDSISKSIEMTFVTDKKVFDKLEKAQARYKDGTIKSTDIKDPAWAKYIPSSKENFTGSDAVQLASHISKVVSDDALVKTIDELAECLVKLTKEVRGNWFVSNKDDIERINQIGETVQKLKLDLGENNKVTKNHVANSFKPLAINEEKSLGQEIFKILKDDKITASFKNKNKVTKSFVLWWTWQSQFRLKAMGGNFITNSIVPGAGFGGAIFTNAFSTEDTKLAWKINKEVHEILKDIVVIANKKTKIANALVSYIYESV